jgi:hypothetical protein
VVIARVYIYYERMTNALVLLKETIDLDPTRGYVWFQMGLCQQWLNLNAAARVSFDRCAELAPGYAPAINAAASLSRGTSLGDHLRGLWRRWSGQ